MIFCLQTVVLLLSFVVSLTCTFITSCGI